MSKCLFLNMCLCLCTCMIYILSQNIFDFGQYLVRLVDKYLINNFLIVVAFCLVNLCVECLIICFLFLCQAGRDGADHRGQILSTTRSGGRLPNLWNRNREEFVQIAISRLLLQMCCLFHTFDGMIWKVCVSSVEKRKFFVWSLIFRTFPYHL